MADEPRETMADRAVSTPSPQPGSAVYLEQSTVPHPTPARPEWGSDVIVAMLQQLGVEYVALNPGASYRGLHDSLVNYGGNASPGMILCNHEEIAVAVAHGYAKLRGRPMGSIVHSNVGLLHATMAIFNAWVDRVPILVMGATGPMDSLQRRPWIDWIHTSHGQGEMVRAFTKWDNQPASVAAIPEAMLRAWHTMVSEPSGPAYLVFDVGLQEQRIPEDQTIRFPVVRRYQPPLPFAPPPEAVEKAASWLVNAESPVILLGRTEQTQEAWDDQVALAEALGAAVLADSQSGASFPTNHPLLQAPLGLRGGPETTEILRGADLILSLERIDPAGTLRSAGIRTILGNAGGPPAPRLIDVSLEQLALGAWSADFQELPPADMTLQCSAAVATRALLNAVQRALRDNPSAARRAAQRTETYRARRKKLEEAWEKRRQQRWEQSPISVTRLVAELRDALGQDYENSILARMPLTWPPGIWNFSRPGSYLGGDGGAGIGSGPGMSVGTALGALGSGRRVVSVLGDGDTLMSPSALWTAAHHRIPLLFVIANNQSYFNDEEHQERMAVARSRPVENRWVGQRMTEPAVNFGGLARDMGVEGFGPVTDPSTLPDVYAQAIRAVDEGRPALVDVRISPR